VVGQQMHRATSGKEFERSRFRSQFTTWHADLEHNLCAQSVATGHDEIVRKILKRLVKFQRPTRATLSKQSGQLREPRAARRAMNPLDALLQVIWNLHGLNR